MFLAKYTCYYSLFLSLPMTMTMLAQADWAANVNPLSKWMCDLKVYCASLKWQTVSHRWRDSK